MYGEVITLFYNIIVYDGELGNIQLLALSALDKLLEKDSETKHVFEKLGGHEALESL